ncbi:Lrp/AsnC family C-terminal domain [Halanaeroarchaeum sp. HSR-CO]|uniref:Lrp/AsnC family transcriptional regulator n=1 Tax=Halanaeroarchaeum sp. HSR-CO TaxID=2866382 RepID=UPI00217F16F4|nr:Lrp/AsnC ligand binding domain-containing protein [Halanaeroarchaeum sp. HSR-CO]UWG47722.1 Lrp/AsnC family C-terminal domain [Halanaeroarchaeum sp. HSR-CO]
MPKAYVTIVTSAKMSPEVVDRLEAVDAVLEAHIVAGDFDIIAELDASETKDLLPVVTRRIQGIEGVGHTRTYIVLD